MIEKMKLEELSETRVPVTLALDTSGSMRGEKIDELNKGIQIFHDAIMREEESRYSVDLSIISFGNSGVNTILDFDMIMNQDVPTLIADGSTPMGQGVSTALDALDVRKQEYKDLGIDYYQPWMVLMTDGWPTDDIEGAVDRTRDLVENRKLTVFPIAIGDADTNLIGRFSPTRPALRLKGLNFAEFFEWLSKSVISLSRSTTESEAKFGSVEGWGGID